MCLLSPRPLRDEARAGRVQFHRDTDGSMEVEPITAFGSGGEGGGVHAAHTRMALSGIEGRNEDFSRTWRSLLLTTHGRFFNYCLINRQPVSRVQTKL